MKIKYIFALVIAFLIVVFAVQNAEITPIRFLFWSLSISRVLVILGSFAVGLLLGWLISFRKKR